MNERNITMDFNTTIRPSHDTGDNAWMMTSTALVLLMTPALAFFMVV